MSYLWEIKQLSEASVQRYWFYLRPLLLWADDVLFSNAPTIRPTFATYLGGVHAYGREALLAPETLKKVINTSKRFFGWAREIYPNKFRLVTRAWIDTLVPPRRDAPSPLEHEFVMLEEAIQLAALNIDRDNLALRRDQAGATMLYLSGMRGGALGSLPIEAVDINAREIRQWPSLGVKTKLRKSATTYLLEIPELMTVVAEWDAFIRAKLPPTAMWFTPIISRLGQQRLSANPPGKNRNLAISKRMRKLFAAAGLPYRSPHKFRHGHAVYGLQRAHMMADYKAVSMNLMHGDVTVTDGIYAPLANDDVRQRISQLSRRSALDGSIDGELVAFLRSLSDTDLANALIILADRLAS